MYNRILVPLDGSRVAEQILPYARWLGESLSIPLELLTVIDNTDCGAQAPTSGAGLLDILLNDAFGRGKSYLEFISGSLAGLRVECTVEKGNTAEVIIEAAAASNTLLALATHGRSGLKRWLLGSIAEKVVRRSSNPVLLVRANEKAAAQGVAPLKTVIVPLDGSQLAESVLPMVAELANKLGLEVILFRAYDVPFAPYANNQSYYNIGLNYDDLVTRGRAETNDYLENAKAEILRLGADKVRCVYKEGMARDAIIALGREAPHNLIAMCTHGRSGITRWAMGSVTENVARHASAPVLILRAS